MHLENLPTVVLKQMCKDYPGRGVCRGIIYNWEKLEMSQLYTCGLGKSSASLCWDTLQLLKNGAGCSHVARHWSGSI